MTGTGDPTVTLLMPVLDAEPYLAAALASIRDQSRPVHQFLVLDGGSTDGSRQRVLSEPGATLVDLPGTGWAAAVNAGLQQARGELIAFAGADDIMEHDALERHVAALSGEPAAGYSSGLVALFADPAGISDAVPAGLAGTVRQARVPESMVVRHTVFEQVGGFRTDIGNSADVEWIVRLGDLGIAPVLIDSVVVRKRLHSGNTTYTGDTVSPGITRSLRLSILRKQGRS